MTFMRLTGNLVSYATSALRTSAAIVRGLGVLGLIALVDEKVFVEFGIFTSALSLLVLVIGFELYQKTNISIQANGAAKNELVSRHLATNIYAVLLMICTFMFLSNLNETIWDQYFFLVAIASVDLFSQESTRLLNSLGSPIKSSIVHFFRLNMWLIFVFIGYCMFEELSAAQLFLSYLMGSLVAALISILLMSRYLYFAKANLSSLINLSFFKYIAPIILSLVLLRLGFWAERTVIGTILPDKAAASYILVLSLLGLLPIAMESMFILSRVQSIHFELNNRIISYRTLVKRLTNIFIISNVCAVFSVFFGLKILVIIKPDILILDPIIIVILTVGYSSFAINSYVSYILYVLDLNVKNMKYNIASGILGILTLLLSWKLNHVELAAAWLVLFAISGVIFRLKFILKSGHLNG